MKELENENKSLRQEVSRLTQENEILRQKVDALAKKLFGKSSEQLNSDEMQLLLKGLEEDAPKKLESDGQEKQEDDTSASQPSRPKAKRKPRQSAEAQLPDNLEVEEIVLIPEVVQQNPELYREVDEEVTTKLDFIPERFQKVVTRRKKFVKKISSFDAPDNDTFHIASLPSSIKERSLLTPALIAEIATNRFCNHQPYYRQSEHFYRRHQVKILRSTMSQWVIDLESTYLKGVFNAMQDELLSGSYLQADETPIEYLSPGHGSTKKGYLWVIAQPDLNATDGRGDILFQWHPSRATDCLHSLLQGQEQTFKGVLQSDGYTAYDCYKDRQEEGEIETIGCLAHIRRKFYDARKQKPKITSWILRHIQHLYGIESALRQKKAGAGLRERVRSLDSRPIFKRLQKAVDILLDKNKALPQSNLGKALSYAQEQLKRLEPCFTNGLLELDNNLIENGIRPTKLGAKNWMFMGSEAAGQTNATWYTLIESCRRRRLDPWQYLKWLFEELPKITVKKDTFHYYTPKAYQLHINKKDVARCVA